LHSMQLLSHSCRGAKMASQRAPRRVWQVAWVLQPALRATLRCISCDVFERVGTGRERLRRDAPSHNGHRHPQPQTRRGGGRAAMRCPAWILQQVDRHGTLWTANARKDFRRPSAVRIGQAISVAFRSAKVASFPRSQGQNAAFAERKATIRQLLIRPS